MNENEIDGYISDLQNAPKEIKDNKYAMLYAIINDTNLIKYASNRLRDNEDFIRTIINIDSSLLNYASNRLKQIIN
jgi:hypothetical protein